MTNFTLGTKGSYTWHPCLEKCKSMPRSHSWPLEIRLKVKFGRRNVLRRDNYK